MDYCFSILCNVLWTIVLLFCAMFYELFFKYFVSCYMDYCFSILCNVLWTIALVFSVMFKALGFV